jgi:hypothetical protein
VRRRGARIVDPTLTCSKFVRQLPNVAVARKVVKVSQSNLDGLVWGIRAGFRDYLDSLDDARVELVGVIPTPQGFLFPAHASGAFGGSLHARAHGGALDVRFAEPALEQTPDGVVLTAELGDGRRHVARLLDVADSAAFTAEGGVATDVALTLDGSSWLGGVYAPWARMDAVHVLRSHRFPSPAHAR